MLAWMKQKLESRLPGKISITPDMQTTLMAKSEEELKSPLMKVKEESEKLAQNSTFQKLRPWHPVSPITSWQTDGETMETVTRLYFLGLQNHCISRLKP